VVFGCKRLYRNIFQDQKYAEAYLASDAEKIGLGKNEMVALAMLLGGDYTGEYIHVYEFLPLLFHIAYFNDVSVLLDGIKGVGIVNGLEILQAFPVTNSVKEGLTAFRKWLDGFDPLDEITRGNDSLSDSKTTRERVFHHKHRSARSRWIAPKDFPAPSVMQAYMKPVVDTSRETLSWGKPHLDHIKTFCSKKIGWDYVETERVVAPVIKQMTSGPRQTRLDGYLMHYEDNIKFAKVKSKRLREVLNLSEEGNSHTPSSRNKVRTPSAEKTSKKKC